MSASLVGSEMCIRDRLSSALQSSPELSGEPIDPKDNVQWRAISEDLGPSFLAKRSDFKLGQGVGRVARRGRQ
eukprot:8030046-Alexandrium_andersonii.AAC.1